MSRSREDCSNCDRSLGKQAFVSLDGQHYLCGHCFVPRSDDRQERDDRSRWRKFIKRR
jgi:hypothetical protein